VFRKLGQQPPACRTHVTRLYGGQIEQFDDYVAEEVNKRPKGMTAEVTRHLIYNYGSAYRQPLRYLNEDACWGQPVTEATSVTKAEILHSVRAEMAQRLTDVVLRRTELGSAKKPDDGCVWTCARIMAAELGWDRYRVEQEVEDVWAAYEIAARHNLIRS
jgi:glycerol-3-phosphate dehydrogenase